MRPGDLTSGAAKLHKAWKKLVLDWEATKQVWRDSVSRQFEEKYLAPLEPQIDATLQRMRALAASSAAAEHDCDH
jgi:hypothetical protein